MYVQSLHSGVIHQVKKGRSVFLEQISGVFVSTYLYLSARLRQDTDVPVCKPLQDAKPDILSQKCTHCVVCFLGDRGGESVFAQSWNF